MVNGGKKNYNAMASQALPESTLASPTLPPPASDGLGLGERSDRSQPIKRMDEFSLQGMIARVSQVHVTNCFSFNILSHPMFSWQLVGTGPFLYNL